MMKIFGDWGRMAHAAVGGMLCAFLLTVSLGCRPVRLPEQFDTLSTPPTIYPDYSDLELPPNIAPLDFEIREEGERFITEISGTNGESLRVAGKNVVIPLSFWQTLLEQEVQGEIRFDIYAEHSGRWRRFRTLSNRVTRDRIDPWLSYRLIEPGYEHHGPLRLVERHLETFEERPFFNGDASPGTCANCHAYQNRRTDRMLFHTRGINGGTILIEGNHAKKIETLSPATGMRAVYPAWHPTLPLVAFSANQTIQLFHSADPDRIEVLDQRSDLLLWDTERNEITPLGDTENIWETFPSWSPDGTALYYCAAESVAAPDGKTAWDERYREIRYNIVKRSFDSAARKFGEPEIVWDAAARNQSALHPRVSPDGHFLIFTVADFGTFPIWHRESDLWQLDLTSGKARIMTEVNSEESESYHTWDSSGRWLIFSSRRDDGLYTRIYLSHINSAGNGSKPFLLPQHDPASNQTRMKSYNIPEPMTAPIPLSVEKIMRTVTCGEPDEANYPSGKKQ